MVYCIVSLSFFYWFRTNAPAVILYLQHAETFEKEIIMTSDQASMKNMRLPKGYQYVPADILHSGEQINQDASSSGEPSERHE